MGKGEQEILYKKYYSKFIGLSKGRAQCGLAIIIVTWPLTGHRPWAGAPLSELLTAGADLRQAGVTASVAGAAGHTERAVVLYQLHASGEQAGTQPGFQNQWGGTGKVLINPEDAKGASHAGTTLSLYR